MGCERLMRTVRAAALGLAMLLVVSASAAAATGSTAVVLVSGITTTTPFTAPGALCTKGQYPRGQTWSFDGARFATSGYAVYTAPENFGSGPVKASDLPLFGGCPTQLPATLTVNSRGDIYANARGLARFIAYLGTHYGVGSVRLVAHSYGGLWTRGALRLAKTYFPAVKVLSLTTLGTPHLGSYLADIAEAINPSLCGHSVVCRLIADALVGVRNKLEPATSQVTYSAVAKWNKGQGTSLHGIPTTAISGNAIHLLPLINDSYYTPNDVLIGLSSAQAAGLDRSGVIPSLGCFPPRPDVHSQTFLPFFKSVKYSLLDDPVIVSEVTQTLAGNPPSTACPDPGGSAVSGLARNAAGTRAIVLLPGTHVSCHGKRLVGEPFFNSTRLQVIAQPSCSTRLQVTPAGASVLYLRGTGRSAKLRAGRGALALS